MENRLVGRLALVSEAGQEAIRLALVELEKRITPSGTRLLQPVAVGPALTAPALTGPTTNISHVSSQDTKVAPASDTDEPAGFIDFTPLAGSANNFTMTLKITLADGTSLTKTYNIAAGSTVNNIETLVIASLQVSTGTGKPGYVITQNKDGTGFAISGFWSSKTGGFIQYKKIEASTEGIGGKTPKVSESPKGTTGQSDTTDSTSSEVAFSILPNLEDGNPALQDNSTLVATVDGVEVVVSLQAGETNLQVANDLFTSLTNAGLAGVSTDGQGNVILTNDFSGMPVSCIGLRIAGNNGTAMDSLDAGVTMYP